MNAKLISFTVAAALLASTSAFAGQPSGRDSVYAAPGVSIPGAQAAKTYTGGGRGSVYASDLPAPTPKESAKVAVNFRAGRA